MFHALPRLFRRACVTAALLLAGVNAATTAEVAERRVLGFSQDGRYFAFMQYGTHDATGAPYADLFVVDLERDAFMPGTPLRVRYGERPVPLARALAELKRRGRAILSRLGPLLPGRIMASRTAMQAGAGDPRELHFYSNYNLRIPSHMVSYRVRPLRVPAAAECSRMNAVGMILLEKWASGSWRPVYEDMRVPRSRHCPRRYELADVIAGPQMDNPLWHVVLVRYFRPGFEGLDGRYLAIPVRIRERK